ncbi:REPEAT-CONTAINING PROTEIN putative-RELATED [Salix koriyanagi]|uniref:REPEAT-CONTAINING PROTEIN putative-RELATED n=1 Tax=Salix koriyanagi TaxID=2511006 RepID=A0A9Q0SL54_9ROSI|nr:REPEAT-CONTAINING PROTEIN putative-RELATED [Salix koriyanagi]
MKDLQKIHAQLIKTGLAKDPIAASRVLAFCTSPAGDINYAYLVFTQIQNRNLFVWNTIIRGFSQSSTPHIAISLFIDMMFTSPNTQPQRLTYPSVFKAYAQLGLAHEGTQLHGRVIKLGLENDQFIQNTILNMYVNCGFLSEAQKIFDGAMGFDVVTWNTMIIGLAKCGEIDKSRRLFDKMLLRNTVSWNSMISGKYGNIEMAKRAAKHVNELDPNESSSFVLLSNVYAAHSHFEEAIEQRLSLKEKQMDKEPGCSLIEVNGEVHEFVSGGRLHPRSKDIYHALDDLGMALKEMG